VGAFFVRICSKKLPNFTTLLPLLSRFKGFFGIFFLQNGEFRKKQDAFAFHLRYPKSVFCRRD
jgi:hypothetical protein